MPNSVLEPLNPADRSRLRRSFVLGVLLWGLAGTPVLPAQGTAGEAASPGSPEAVSATIVDSLAKNDYAEFASLVLTRDELVGQINASSDSDKNKALLGQQAVENSKKMFAASKACFDRTLSLMQADGIVPGQIRFKTCLTEFKKDKGLDYLNLKILFEFGGAEYVLRSKTLLKTSSGWKVTGDLSFEPAAPSRPAEDANAPVPRPAYFVNRGVTSVTEGNRSALFAGRDLTLEIPFQQVFLKYDKIVVWFDPLTSDEKREAFQPREFGASVWKKEFLRKNLTVFEAKRHISVVLLRPDGDGDFIVYWNASAGWVNIAPEFVLGKHDADFGGCKGEFCKRNVTLNLVVKGYMKTGTEERWESRYTDGSGELTKRIYDVYDGGVELLRDSGFVIKANK